MTRARDVADTQDNTGGAVAPFLAGKNKIINGDFGIWQRGTSFTGSSLAKTYFADRFYVFFTGNGSPSFSATRQSFTPGTAPVSGYESPFFARFACTNVGSGVTSRDIWQPIEDVRTLAGQTVTLSYWAKASTSLSISPMWSQVFGSGGSAENASVLSPVTLTTSWQRFTVTFTLTSMSGKTIGDASNALYIGFRFPTDLFQIDMWGIQLEAGNVATPFTTATGTIAGELILCQRYYAKTYNQGVTPGTATANGAVVGFQLSTTQANAPFVNWNLPVEMRTTPTLTGYSKNSGASGKMGGGSTDYNFATNGAVNGTGRVCAYPAGTIPAIIDCYFQITAEAEF